MERGIRNATRPSIVVLPLLRFGAVDVKGLGCGSHTSSCTQASMTQNATPRASSCEQITCRWSADDVAEQRIAIDRLRPRLDDPMAIQWRRLVFLAARLDLVVDGQRGRQALSLRPCAGARNSNPGFCLGESLRAARPRALWPCDFALRSVSRIGGCGGFQSGACATKASNCSRVPPEASPVANVALRRRLGSIRMRIRAATPASCAPIWLTWSQPGSSLSGIKITQPREDIGNILVATYWHRRRWSWRRCRVCCGRANPSFLSPSTMKTGCSAAMPSISSRQLERHAARITPSFPFPTAIAVRLALAKAFRFVANNLKE